MGGAAISGTEGYAEEASELLRIYESVEFAEVHAAVLPLIPRTPSRVLDVGAGTGRDAAAYADMGHSVVAVEPTDEMRLPAMKLHSSPAITWIKDSLPELAALEDETFDLVTLSAVWMHFDADQRTRGMTRLTALLRDGGTLILSLRHGPIPPGRRMFEISGEETITLARQHGFTNVLNVNEPSRREVHRLAGVTWTRMAFVKG